MKNLLTKLFLFTIIINCTIYSQTNVSGRISINTTWDKSGNPFIVTDDLSVGSGVTLTIKAGVLVKFYNDKNIFVKGKLIAIGTKDSIINFTSQFGNKWGSINITSNDTSIFYYCKLNYGTNSIVVDGSSYTFRPSLIINKCWISNNVESGVKVITTQGFISIDSSYFLNNSTGVYFNWLLSNGKLTNSVIWKSGQYGIRCNVSQFDINNNEIYENKIGIYFTSNQTNFIRQNNIINNDIGIFNDYTNGTSYTTVNFNNIAHNIFYNFKNGSSSGFSFPNNWWGSAQINFIDSLILDEKDNITLGLVNYLPYLSKPDTSTPPISPVKLKILQTGNDYISILWDSTLNNNIKGYKVYYDTDSSGFPYSNSIDVGNVKSYKLTTLSVGKKYYIAVTVYDINGNESWYSNEVSATTVPPLLWVGSSITFDNTIANDSSFKYLNIISQSSSALTISAVSNNTSIFQKNISLPITVNGGDTLKLKIAFKPTLFGTVTDTLKITSDGGNASVVLTGTSPYPVLVTNASSLSYGAVARNNSKPLGVKISNSSINTLTVDSIYTKTKQFVANKLTGTVAMNETLSVMIDFKADTFAVYTDTLYLRNNSVNGLVKIPLKGESPIPVLTLLPNVYRKDSVAVGDSSSQVFVIKNTSVNDLSFDSVKTKTLPFLIKGAITGLIKSNDSTLLAILFKPNAFGVYSDTLSVMSLGKITKMALSGSSPYPKMVMSLSSLDFGNVRKDTASKKTIVVKNTSINKLRIDSLKTKSTQFTVDKLTSPVFVTKKDSAVFIVTFKADTIKKYNDTLSIFSNQNTPVVFVALTGSGTLTSVLSSDDLMPKQYELNQNYPNPFNPSTTIRFGIPNESNVRLEIYNLLGQLVETLVNEMLSANFYEVKWEAGASPTGLYFYKIIAIDINNPNNKLIQTKKMMLVK